MMAIIRLNTHFISAVVLAALLLNQVATSAEPNSTRQPSLATHVVAGETPYYLNAPQQGQRSDGSFTTGTSVKLIRRAGSYAQVETDQGSLAFVASESLANFVAAEAITPEVRQVAESINEFAFDLYRETAKDKGNLFASPASISTALAMTYAGAAGETEKEMAQVLHFGAGPTRLPANRMHAAYGTLSAMLNSGGSQGGYVLRTANRLWGQQSYKFQPEFLKITREHYGAELTLLDFTKSEDARGSINQWVEQETRQKIRDLIPTGGLPVDTRLVLTNAIYFLGRWDHEFSESTTTDQPFFVDAQQAVEVPLMTLTGEFRYADAESVQMVELPYRGNEISMLVILPRQRDVLPRLEQELSGKFLAAWTTALRQRQIQLFLPKFKLTTQANLKATLTAMGMPTPFSDEADFSSMSSVEQLKIAAVIHKAFVDVNEQGTEAAAATAVVAVPASATIRSAEPIVFRADHPFVFLLRDNRSGAILFLGRVSDPR